MLAGDVIDCATRSVGRLLSVAVLAACAGQPPPSELEVAAESGPTVEQLDAMEEQAQRTFELQQPEPRCETHPVPSPLSRGYYNCPGRPDPCPSAPTRLPPDEAMARRIDAAEGWCSDWSGTQSGGVGVVFDQNGTLFWRINWGDLYSPQYNGSVCWSLEGSTVMVSEFGRDWYEEPMSVTDGDPPSLIWNERSYVPCRQFPEP